MNEERLDSDARGGEVPRAISDDLGALRDATGRGLPGLDRTLRGLEERGRVTRLPDASPVRWRWAAAAGFGIVLLLVLLALPVSYQRLVGCEVRLTLQGDRLRAATAERVAERFGGAFGAHEVRVRPLARSVGFVVSAIVAPRPGAEVDAMAAAFAGELAAEGVAVRHETRPVRKRVSGNVGTLARARAVELRLRVKGRGLAAIVEEIRRDFMLAGAESVRVSPSADGRETRLVVKLVPGEGRSADGHLMIVFEAGPDDSTNIPHTLLLRDDPRDSTATSGQRRERIERRLREEGFEGDVRVLKDGIVILVRRPPARSR